MTTFDVQAVRKHFPALQQQQVFLDSTIGIMLFAFRGYVLTLLGRCWW